MSDKVDDLVTMSATLGDLRQIVAMLRRSQ